MAAMPNPGSRPWLRWGLIAAVVLLLVAGGVVAFVLAHSPGNVSHPSVEFTRPTTTTPPPPKRKVAVDNFEWPRYGFDAARTRVFAGGRKLDPPFRVGWTFEDYALLEFPPVIFGHRLFLMDDDGSAKAIDARNGRKLWETKVGTLAAASPALGAKQGLLFLPILSVHTHSPGGGYFDALSLKTGKLKWSMPVGAGTESSPIAWENSVYFGDQSGKVYSLDARTGHINWTFQASGAVKGGPALVDGTLYFGDYAGRAYALNAANGHQVWAVSTSGTRFGFGSGNFYATPAVGLGRRYKGNTPGPA
jgi:outer membrane protein assembly factor BamB